jgi:hypothetical protein
MKAVKLVIGLIVAYVAIVIIFESLIGYFQPADQSTLVMTTADEMGGRKDRVLARIESNGQIYVAANHWPRQWYERALSNPNVRVTLDASMEGSAAAYLAVPVTGNEHDRVSEENGVGLGFRILTGFPPRYFVRLDPL